MDYGLYNQDLASDRSFRTQVAALAATIPMDKQIDWAFGKVKEHLDKVQLSGPDPYAIFDTLRQTIVPGYHRECLDPSPVEDVLLEVQNVVFQARTPSEHYHAQIWCLMDLLDARNPAWILFPFCCNLVLTRDYELRAQKCSYKRRVTGRRVMREQILKELAAL